MSDDYIEKGFGFTIGVAMAIGSMWLVYIGFIALKEWITK